MPGEAAASAFMKGGCGWGDGESGIFCELGVGLADFGEGSLLGLVGDAEAGEIGEGWHLLFAAFFQEVIGESGEIGFNCGGDDGVVGPVRLDEDFGEVEVATTDAADDLGEKLEGALFGGEIGESEARVGLDDADGGEMGEIETAGESLSADENVDIAGVDVVVVGGETVSFLIITVKTGDFCVGEETLELGFEEFRAETFMNNARVAALGARGGDFFFVAANVTT